MAPRASTVLGGVLVAHQLSGGRALVALLELVHLHEPLRRAILLAGGDHRHGAKDVDVIVPRRQQAWAQRW